MENAPHILIIDDDREIRDLLSRFLEKQGLRVSAARMRATPGGYGHSGAIILWCWIS